MKTTEEQNQDKEDKERSERLFQVSKIVSDFLLTTEIDFKKEIYGDGVDRICCGFDIEVGEHTLTILCNEDGYIGFEIKDEKDKPKIA